MKRVKNIVILAGGNGDRFWPLKEKFLIPFLGKPFMKHLLEKLSLNGENTYVIGSRENKSSLEAVIDGAATLLIQENGEDGMAGAILACKGVVHGPSLVIGNDLIRFDIVEKLIEKAGTTDAEMVFLAKKMISVYFPGGYLQLEGERVKGIVEKPDPHDVPSDLVRLVVDYYRDMDAFVSIVDGIRSDKDDRYEQGMNAYIAKGSAEYVVYEGYWQALKYPWQILQMDAIFRSGMTGSSIDPSTRISERAHIEGAVHIGKNCKIGDFVKISGPCYIGDNTIIGDYSLVRESSIGNDVMVGSGCEVARSYLGDGASLHRNYVGDSYIGKRVLCGAGAVTANFRFDQKHIQSTVAGRKVDTNLAKLGAIVGNNSKVGVNTTLFPGVKIGTASIIAPGEIVTSDIPEKMYVSRGKLTPNKL